MIEYYRGVNRRDAILFLTDDEFQAFTAIERYILYRNDPLLTQPKVPTGVEIEWDELWFKIQMRKNEHHLQTEKRGLKSINPRLP